MTGCGGGRMAVWVGAPKPVMDSYLAGNVTPSIAVTTNYNKFLGLVTATNGLGMVNPPDPNAAQPGTAYFFVFTQQGLLMQLQ